MWNPNPVAGNSQEEDIMVTIWPPRSYTCTFCKREFRSAQALGGHMNVHRRDRALLHHAQPNLRNMNVSSNQELVGNGGLCLFYSLPKTVAAVTRDSSSTSTNSESNGKVNISKKRKEGNVIVEAIDLELRLGCSSSAS